MSSVSDWISVGVAIVATIAALATLVTVYIAAQQLITQHRAYSLGLSRQSLGDWEPKVTSSSLFGLQRKVCTPTISLPTLVARSWKPEFAFPTGFSDMSDLENSALARTSWVNFLQSLGLSPDNDPGYEMQFESELVNGIVPMRWKGKDLVAVCSMLGFQSHEDEPSFKSPMPLPMQWSGPLGWMQFRASSDGCVAEFRRRRNLKNQLSEQLLTYFGKHEKKIREDSLVSRLWNSIGGFSLPNQCSLFLGGTDRQSRNTEETETTPEPDVYDDLLAEDLSEKDIMHALWGKAKDRPKALRPEAIEKGPSQLSSDDPFRDLRDQLLGSKSTRLMEVLRPCPGLLSVTAQGELASSRGLDFNKCHEYDRLYVDIDEVDTKSYPYHLGDRYMDRALLELMKKAVILLRPDGFFFTPTAWLYSDVHEVFRHVEKLSDERKKERRENIFNNIQIKDFQDPHESLYYAMELCNYFQLTRTFRRADFTVEDMRIICIASTELDKILSPQASLGDTDPLWDIFWAMVVSPELLEDVVKGFNEVGFPGFLQAKIATYEKPRQGKTLFFNLPQATGASSEPISQKYTVPLVSDGNFSGTQILAACAHVFIRYFWVEKKWITDVCIYDATIPQSVTMC